MEKLLKKLTDNLEETFTERLSSVFLYGSYADEDCARGEFSDINLMVIIKDLKAADLKKAHPFVKKFAGKSKSLPIFMGLDEWFDSTDVYAMECSEIKSRYRILRGENLIESLSVEKRNLRLQCESEVKNLLIRLRQGYILNPSDKRAIKKLIIASFKTFMVVFRTVLRLTDDIIPKSNADVIKAAWEKIISQEATFDGEMFLKILEYKNNQKNAAKIIADSELEEIVQKLIDSTNYVLKYVDKLNI